MTEETTYIKLAKGMILLIIGLLILRFFPALWGSLLVIFVFLSAVAMVYWLYQRSATPDSKATKDDFVERLLRSIEDSKKRAEDYRNEASQIVRSRRELAEQLDRTVDPGPEADAKGRRLLQELDDEQALRLSKANFFDTSQRELKELLERYRLHQQLLAKEAELERLRSENYDDAAQLEKVRYQVERDQTRLSTIIELTHRAAISPNLNDTERLRLSLEKEFLDPPRKI